MSRVDRASVSMQMPFGLGDCMLGEGSRAGSAHPADADLGPVGQRIRVRFGLKFPPMAQ